ncbi:Hsp20/alpha crystallin family protein [Neobacillus vireti]|uniref:Hsp20/alpha crystallin family protein n=1 Tax=Neobacillus vireti TaxID=220686 RepID=UPI002FFE66D2
MVKPHFHSHVKQMLGEDFSELLQELSPFAEPRLDMYKTDQNLIISVDLAGASREDFTVKMRNDTLIIEGTINNTQSEKNIQVISREQFYGSFMRKITIPEEYNLNQLQAVFERGILLITVPFKTCEVHNLD